MVYNMRANEFIAETADGEFDPVYQAAIKNAVHFPDQNMSTGSAYLNYRFGIAMAGAPDFPTPPAGAFAGDPLLATYTDVDLEIINAAAKSVGAGAVNKLTDNRSTEPDYVGKVSPVRAFKGYPR